MNDTLLMQSSEQMFKLLNELVSIESVTLSEAEKDFPLHVKNHLLKIPYYLENPSLISLHPTSDDRTFLTALYKNPQATKTVIMISYFDVVGVEVYGDLKHLAFFNQLS